MACVKIVDKGEMLFVLPISCLYKKRLFSLLWDRKEETADGGGKKKHF